MSTFDLEGFAARFRLSSFPKAQQPGDLMVLGDMESTVVLSERAGVFVVETESHGGRRKFLGSFSKRDDAQRLIVYWIGSGAQGDPADGFGFEGATLDAGPISTHLSWTGGSAEFGPGTTGRMWAERFNWARERSLEKLAARFG